MLLFADFVPAETTWAHIRAVRSVVETYGVPLHYPGLTRQGRLRRLPAGLPFRAGPGQRMAQACAPDR